MTNPKSVYEKGKETAKRNWFASKIFYTLLGNSICKGKSTMTLEELIEEADGTAKSYAHIIQRL